MWFTYICQVHNEDWPEHVLHSHSCRPSEPLVMNQSPCRSHLLAHGASWSPLPWHWTPGCEQRATGHPSPFTKQSASTHPYGHKSLFEAITRCLSGSHHTEPPSFCSFTCLSTSSVIFLILVLQSMVNRSSCLSINSNRSWWSSLVSRQ